MKLTDKRFWIAWAALVVLMVVVMAQCSWSDDTMILGIGYALSLLSTWLCRRIRPKAAFGNLLVMVLYNAILGYNLIFNNHAGAGFTWWFFLLLLNGIHSIGLLIYYVTNVRFTVLDYIWYVSEAIREKECNYNMSGLTILSFIWWFCILVPLIAPLMYSFLGNPTTIIVSLILLFLPELFCRLRYTSARKQTILQHYSGMRHLWRRMFIIVTTALILTAFNLSLMYYLGFIHKA